MMHYLGSSFPNVNVPSSVQSLVNHVHHSKPRSFLSEQWNSEGSINTAVFQYEVSRVRCNILARSLRYASRRCSRQNDRTYRSLSAHLWNSKDLRAWLRWRKNQRFLSRVILRFVGMRTVLNQRSGQQLVPVTKTGVTPARNVESRDQVLAPFWISYEPHTGQRGGRLKSSGESQG